MSHKERKLGLLGKKLGMTRIFSAEGESLGVTVIELGPCLVVAKRTAAKNPNGHTDGYCALQLGFDTKPVRKVNKPEEGHLKAAGGKETAARRFVREVRVAAELASKFEVGQQITLKELGLKLGDFVDVTGRSKGKGFQGSIKRHHFSGFPATHGTHEYFRHGGSIGCRKWPGRVFKGRRMPGHMGDERVTTQNLKVVQVREDDNVVLVLGSVPGSVNSYVTLRASIKRASKSA